MRGSLARAVLCLGLIGSGAARAENLSGADLMRALSGNTLTGFNGSLWFSEWHGPDGRVLGHNAGVKNQDSCWTVRGDAVCYYYPRNRTNEQDARTEFCWHLERAGTEAYRIRPAGRPGGGFARLEPGNPRGHTDNGKSWICDALISRHEPGDAVARVAAGGQHAPARMRQAFSAERSASPTSPVPLP